jgi:hypothetical protein
MGKASSSKKVARAAGTGGGRTTRGKTPVLWYGTLVVILLGGIALTAFSRQQRLDKLSSPASNEAPKANADHWHTALGVYVCDHWLEPVKDQTDPVGIHTHGEGVIHVHPFVASAAGRRATFQRFAETVKGDLHATRFTWPEGDGKKKVEHKNGDKCGDQVGEVKAFYDGQPRLGDPGDIRLTDKGVLVLAFVPKDTTYEKIGDPPSKAGLSSLSDVDPSAAQQQSQQVPAGGSVPGGPAASTPAVSTPAVSTPAASTPAASTPAAPNPTTAPAAGGAAGSPPSSAP